MELVNKVKKNKMKLIYKLENIKELNNLNFDELIPENVQNVEIVYSDVNNILKIDYIVDLEITK